VGGGIRYAGHYTPSPKGVKAFSGALQYSLQLWAFVGLAGIGHWLGFGETVGFGAAEAARGPIFPSSVPFTF
jgi:hypothetical protein